MINETNLVDEQGFGPIAVNQFGEKFFFNLNRHGFDKISAQALFDAKFGDDLFKEDALYVIVGTDSGLLPRYIQSRPLPKGTRYIFIEPDVVLRALHVERLLADLDERIACISLQDWDEAIRNFKITDYLYINGVRSFNAICAQDDFINEYAELSWHITEVLSQLHWESSVELGEEAFIARQINNVADNRLPAKLLEKAFRDKTVVLLAGGPSLDEALPWVKQHRDNVVVFAVSRISRQLLQAEIEPDFIFSVDPTELSFDISKEMFSLGERAIFICSYHVVPTLLNQWSGLVFYLGARVPWDSPLNVANFGGAGPTVTNTALTAAHEFGFKRVILAGVDLCFTREGYTHAKGSNEHLAGPRFDLTSLQVETNGGFWAPTTCDLDLAIRTLNLQAKMLTSAGCQLINCSAGAAKIECVDYMPLSDIRIQDERIDVRAVVNGILKDKHDTVDFFQKLADDLRRAKFQIKAIARLAANARQINDEMYNSDGVIANYKDKKKLDQIEKKIKRDHRHFSKLVKRFGIRRFIKISKPFTDEEWTADEVKQLGNVFYDAYLDGASKLLGLIDDAIERLNARQEEYSDTPDFKILIEQARKDRSFGRVRLWQQKYARFNISPEIAKVFAEFEQQFDEIMGDKDTRHFARAKHHSSLAVVKHRAGLLFKHKKAEDLKGLASGLDKHEQQQAAMPYRFLIAGYLAELEGDIETALDAYQQIIDNNDVLLEEALIRIADIGIERDDMHTTNLALQCLSQLNPAYLPFYAEIQRLHGDAFHAIDIYNSYIQQFPSDMLVQIKLAMLYIEFKIYDAAELMLDHILQQNPKQEAAMAIKRQLLTLRDQ